MRPDEAREALETVIRSHTANMLDLERILAAWRDMTHSDRIVTDDRLTEALVRAEGNKT